MINPVYQPGSIVNTTLLMKLLKCGTCRLLVRSQKADCALDIQMVNKKEEIKLVFSMYWVLSPLKYAGSNRARHSVSETELGGHYGNEAAGRVSNLRH